MPLPPIITCFIKIQIGLSFQVAAYSSRTGKEAVKQVSVWLSVCQNNNRSDVCHCRNVWVSYRGVPWRDDGVFIISETECEERWEEDKRVYCRVWLVSHTALTDGLRVDALLLFVSSYLNLLLSRTFYATEWRIISWCANKKSLTDCTDAYYYYTTTTSIYRPFFHYNLGKLAPER